MRPPRVSVVIPTYNRCVDVQAAVRSVLAQDYPQELIEIIVVDDGGKDDTVPVLGRVFGERVRVVSKPNGGVSSARNHGARLATGELLAFLDSDDTWRPTKITRQHALIAADPACALVLTDLELIDEHGKTSGTLRRRDHQYEGDAIALARLVRFPDLDPSCTLMKTSVFRELGGFDEGLPTAEDIDFLLRLAVRHPIANVEELLTVSLRHPTQGLSNLARTTRDFVSVVERFVAGHDLPPAVAHGALYATYVRNARNSMWVGDVRYSLECLARAAIHARGVRDAQDLAKQTKTISRAFAGQVKKGLKRAVGRA